MTARILHAARTDEHAFCARIECPNGRERPTPLRIRHNRGLTKFWWGADCCPTEPQPGHSVHINDDMHRTVWALNNWTELTHIAAGCGLLQARLTDAAPMLGGTQ